MAYVTMRSSAISETFIRNEVEAVARLNEIEVRTFDANYSGAFGQKVSLALRACCSPNWKQPDLSLAGLVAEQLASNLTPALEAWKPDILHGHFLGIPSQVCHLLGLRLGVPHTVTTHAADYLLQPPKRLARLLDLPDHVFTISENAKRRLSAAAVDGCEGRLSVVRASPGTLLFDKARQPTPGGPLRGIAVARLVAKKGLLDAVTVTKIVRSRGYDMTLDIIGDGPERRHLNSYIESLKLSGSVKLLGSMPNTEVRGRLKRYNVAILPCRQLNSGDADGIPVFLMEAAASGIPVLTTKVGGIDELFEPPYPLSTTDTVGSLANLAIELAAGRLDLARAVSLVQSRLRQEFDSDTQAARLAAIWSGLSTRSADEQ